MEQGGCIYILTNTNKTTLYIGVTSDLRSRLWEHKTKVYKNSFSSKYNLDKCIYYEIYPSIEEAINREKQIKNWIREKKNNLISTKNPKWVDLWEEIKMW